ncbi:MAG: leucine-rich repeat domain-containing protein [Sedimentisphaerales bacterium]|nr:leucine-rich repeat domain-containing protein [Sedimentisphaerales bacterium]
MRTQQILSPLAVAAALTLGLSLVASAEDPVRFGDVNLRAAVEAELGKTDPTPTDMLALTSLNAYHMGVTDLKGLEYATNLTRLQLEGNGVNDLSPLAGLIHLTSLDLWGNQVSDASSLSGLTHLTLLSLWGNQISDASSLAALTNLTWLSLGRNQISDISFVAGLTHLTALYLGENQVTDIAPLAGLADLSILDLGENQIRDLSPLVGLTHLTELYLRANPLNREACTIHIPQIFANNGDMTLHYDPCIDRCTLTISATAGGSVTDPGEGSFNYDTGTIVPVVATAQSGWHFAGWTGTAADAGMVTDPTSESTTVTVDDGYTLKANFVANQHTLTMLSGEGGTVTAEVVFEASSRTLTGPGSHVLDHGSEVEMTAVPNAAWFFTAWTGTIASVESTIAFRLTADYQIEAHFAQNPQTLSVTCGQGGTVTRPGIGSFAYERGATVPVEATPNPGYRFARWKGTVVDRKDIADPRLGQTRVILNEGGTLRATFELLRLFHESWETATVRGYEPCKAQFISGDEGVWFPEDAVSLSTMCGPTPQRAEVLQLESGHALLLTSNDSRSACSDIMSTSLTEAALVNPGFAVPVDANTVLSFYEVGLLDDPKSNESREDCRIAPCFDNVSLLLSDDKGNVLAYVLQRAPAAVANAPNANFGDTYREIFLDPTGIYYQRNVLHDLQTIPAFDPIGAEVRSIEFRVDEHGSAVIDDIIIGPGTAHGTAPVYRFWSPVLESHFFTTGAEEKQTLVDVFSGIWTFEGIAYFTLMEARDPNAVPVYRFWSPTLSSHFYTISEEEKNMLVRDFPGVWTLEGVAFHAFGEGRQPADTCPVYRFWSGTLGCHFYTSSEAERDNLVSHFSQVWTLEGVAWYAYPPQWDSGQAMGIVRDSRTSKNP